GRLALGDRPPAGGAVAAPPRPGRAAPGRTAGREASRRPRGGGPGPGGTGRRRQRARAGRRPGPRDLAADVRRGPAGGRGRGADGGFGGQGEEPPAPGPAADGGGPAARPTGRGRRRAMIGADEPAGGHGDVLPGPRDVDLDRVWLGVAAQVWHRHPGPVERLAAPPLRPPGLAPALVTTPPPRLRPAVPPPPR